MEPDYSNREISAMFHEVKEIVTRVEDQTKKTNGRVTELEKGRWIAIGAMMVITLMIIPILSWALYTLVNIKETVHSSVDEALSAYEVNDANQKEKVQD